MPNEDNLMDVKGLGNHKKNVSIKNIFCNHCPEIISLQETKKRKVDTKCLSSVWGVYNKGWITVPSHGTAGGLLIAWKGDSYDLITTEYGTFLSVKLQEKQQGNLWWITCVYGLSINADKSDFWIELNDIGNLIDAPWCTSGDFNEILSLQTEIAPPQ